MGLLLFPPIGRETAFGLLGQSQPELLVYVASIAGLLDPHGIIYKRLQHPLLLLMFSLTLLVFLVFLLAVRLYVIVSR